MINLCLVVIATQFSETKRRETERMIAERKRFSPTSSTLLSDFEQNEPGSCWDELLKFISYIFKKAKRKLNRRYSKYKKKDSSNNNINNSYMMNDGQDRDILSSRRKSMYLRNSSNSMKLQCFKYHASDHQLYPAIVLSPSLISI